MQTTPFNKLVLTWVTHAYFSFPEHLFGDSRFQVRGPSYRDRYQSFWTILAEKIQSSEDQFVASKEGIAMLKIITDQLVSLSRCVRYSRLFFDSESSASCLLLWINIDHLFAPCSMAVVNVRDAVTEASLIIGQRAVACCVGLRARYTTFSALQATYTYMCTYAYAYICIHVHMYIHVYVETRVHTYLHAHIHISIYNHTDAYAWTCT